MQIKLCNVQKCAMYKGENKTSYRHKNETYRNFLNFYLSLPQIIIFVTFIVCIVQMHLSTNRGVHHISVQITLIHNIITYSCTKTNRHLGKIFGNKVDRYF